jgi:hypothetical protein
MRTHFRRMHLHNVACFFKRKNKIRFRHGSHKNRSYDRRIADFQLPIANFEFAAPILFALSAAFLCVLSV